MSIISEGLALRELHYNLRYSVAREARQLLVKDSLCENFTKICDTQ
jgi:hypothetical protein